MYSILHISDLHRSADDPLDNDTLFASLVADRNRYLGESPRIPPPEAIVVSGDLIEGAPIGAPDWENVIKKQYEVAFSFLSQLCQRFLEGDKSRMILIPGNHDVCWNTSYRAMRAVAHDEFPDDVHAVLVQPNSTYRWSWSTRRLYQIRDQVAYEQRMDRYWELVQSFYENEEYVSIDRTRGYQLFELCQRHILVAGFDSISGNDCYNFAGSLARGAVGRCAIELDDVDHSYGLKIAVWHHSIQGPPVKTDYMDASHVHQMIGHGFQLGLHGHQHVAGAFTQYVHLDATSSMPVVSAGSLCAGARQLPRGVNRQYNLIVVEDDFLTARVHVREMGDGGQFTRKSAGAFLSGFLEITWQPQTNVAGIRSDAHANNLRRTVEDAESALRAGDTRRALTLLGDSEVGALPHARKLKIAALMSEHDWDGLIRAINEPVTVEERVLLIEALIQTNQLKQAGLRLLEYHELDATTRTDLQDRLETKRIMRES